MGNNRFSIVFGELSLSANVLKNKNVQLYPNPSASFINIILPESKINQSAEISFIDQLGRVVYTTKQIFNNSKLTLDINSLSPGMYLININTDESNWVAKVIKQ